MGALGSMWRNADGERVLAKKLGGDTYHRWSLRDTSGQVLRDYLESGNPVTWVVEKDYLYRGDKLLASETPTAVTEYHLDHLGTPRALSKNGGNLTFHTYYPFGEEAGISLDTERMKFTGHERDLGDPNSTGDDLDYMHARFCSPVTGRFLAVDPASSAKPAVPQSWNKYAYTLGNPLRYVDPDGREQADSVQTVDPTYHRVRAVLSRALRGDFRGALRAALGEQQMLIGPEEAQKVQQVSEVIDKATASATAVASFEDLFSSTKPKEDRSDIHIKEGGVDEARQDFDAAVDPESVRSVDGALVGRDRNTNNTIIYRERDADSNSVATDEEQRTTAGGRIKSRKVRYYPPQP